MELINQLMTQFPIVATILAVIGGLRVIFKPIMTAIEAIVAATPSDKDNLVVEGIKANVLYKGFVWILDFFASVKLPKK